MIYIIKDKRIDSPMCSDNIRLQRCWCVSDSGPYRKQVHAKVSQCHEWLRDLKLPVGNVLCLGSQYGFELEQMAHAANSVLGVELVPDFIEVCRKHGRGQVVHGCAEHLRDIVNGQWNIYCSHTLEHAYDRVKAAEQIQLVADRWILIEVPCETVVRDKAHLSSFACPDDVLDLFPGWTVLKQETTRRERKDRCNFRVLFARRADA